jgi:uncharacterized protein (DUF2249 family)
VDIDTEVGSSGDGAPPVGAPRHALDVRPPLAQGEEPFQEIKRAVGALDDDHVFLLRSPFDPQPLHAMLGRQGFARQTRMLAEHDYETAYWRLTLPDADAAARRADAAPARTVPRAAHMLDVRGLLPPEPMERTLAALEGLPAGDALLHINDRVPVFLIQELDEQGYSYRIGEDVCGTLVTIWRATAR